MERIVILIIAFSDSIHTARWISNIQGENMDIHLFPSIPFRNIHSAINHITIHELSPSEDLPNSIKQTPALRTYRIIESLFGKKNSKKVALKFFSVNLQVLALQKVINKISPHIIHTMETQKAGYLMSQAFAGSQKKNFKWIHSTWGIDFHYFQQFNDHLIKIGTLLKQINLLICEGQRDISIAQKLGYCGSAIIIPSVGGGIDFDLFDNLPVIETPQKKTIIIKGYDGDERCASVALKALTIIKNQLSGYTILVYSCSKRLLPIIEELKSEEKINIKATPEMSYEELLRLVCQARISITNNLSDGVPNTMLEAMALGAFPVQSRTAITDGWIEHGVNGCLTDPQNAENIANAVSQAITDDEMVSKAATYNRMLLRKKLNRSLINQLISEAYQLQ